MLIYYLFSPNCPVCSEMLKTVHVLTTLYDVVLCDVTDADCHALSVKHGITNTPTILFERDNVIIGRAEGPGTLAEIIAKIQKLTH